MSGPVARAAEASTGAAEASLWLAGAVLLLCGGLSVARRWCAARARRGRAALLFGPVAAPGGRVRSASHRWRAAQRSSWRSLGRLGPAAVGLSLLVLAGGRPLGIVLGVLAAALVWQLRGEPEGAGPRRKADLRAAGEQLPYASDLLAACMAAGSRPQEAAQAVGAGMGGPLGARLLQACQELRLGADPTAAWERVAEVPGGRRLARCLERAEQSGAPAVEEMTRQASEARAAQARGASARARRAAVLVTGPLGLCFLPAFLLASVVPVVIALGLRLA